MTTLTAESATSRSRASAPLFAALTRTTTTAARLITLALSNNPSASTFPGSSRFARRAVWRESSDQIVGHIQRRYTAPAPSHNASGASSGSPDATVAIAAHAPSRKHTVTRTVAGAPRRGPAAAREPRGLRLAYPPLPRGPPDRPGAEAGGGPGV